MLALVSAIQKSEPTVKIHMSPLHTSPSQPPQNSFQGEYFKCVPFIYYGAFLVAQLKNPLKQCRRYGSDPLVRVLFPGEETATHSSIPRLENLVDRGAWQASARHIP